MNQIVPTFHGFFQLETEGFWRGIAEQKRVDLLAQSRELLKLMQAG